MRRCKVCHRPLRTKKARQMGIGPKCIGKIKGLREAKRIEAEGQLSLFPRRPWAYRRPIKKLMASKAGVS